MQDTTPCNSNLCVYTDDDDDRVRWYVQIMRVIDCCWLFTAVGRSSAFGFPWIEEEYKKKRSNTLIHKTVGTARRLNADETLRRLLKNKYVKISVTHPRRWRTVSVICTIHIYVYNNIWRVHAHTKCIRRTYFMLIGGFVRTIQTIGITRLLVLVVYVQMRFSSVCATTHKTVHVHRYNCTCVFRGMCYSSRTRLLVWTLMAGRPRCTNVVKINR